MGTVTETLGNAGRLGKPGSEGHCSSAPPLNLSAAPCRGATAPGQVGARAEQDGEELRRPTL